MLFNSIEFLCFLPIVFGLYWFVLKDSLRGQNALIVLASYVFYGAWDVRFLSLIILSSVVDFFLGKAIHDTNDKRRRKLYLIMSLSVNLGLLGFFKYYGFFVDSFVDLLNGLGFQAHRSTLNIILPVGISFYTFQTLSYTIDIYRKQLKPTRDPVAFFAFVAFFPQLVAGPIERASNLLPQFLKNRNFDEKYAISGLRIMLWGFFKKVVIADRLAEYVDIVYSTPGEFQGLSFIIATFFFALQIYCDFSGYSDIAIGVARLFGFDLMTNFRTPYFATSLREFWQRWHISLSTWFRDYVYIPLGGNRVGEARKIFNLMVTFLVSGLWHGANWTFVIWGGIHGMILSFETLFRKSKPFAFVPNIIKGVFIFTVVCLAWIFFRANNVSDAFLIFNNTFTGLGNQLTNSVELENALRSFIPSLKEFKNLAISLLLFGLVEVFLYNKSFHELVDKWKTPVRWVFYYLILFWIIYFGAFNKGAQFIYFQF